MPLNIRLDHHSIRSNIRVLDVQPLPVTPEVAGSSPVAPVPVESPANAGLYVSHFPSRSAAREEHRRNISSRSCRLSIRQLELSDTRVFDRPAAGRAWFERTIADQLDLGHPDRVQIVFGRKVTRTTPGRFQTKVITTGVAPVIQAHYKNSKVSSTSRTPAHSGPRRRSTTPTTSASTAPSAPIPGTRCWPSATTSTPG
jgi:hypothetical protein